jgi:hypothetical protein
LLENTIPNLISGYSDPQTFSSLQGILTTSKNTVAMMDGEYQAGTGPLLVETLSLHQ